MLSWKRPITITESSSSLRTPQQSEHVPESIVQTLLELCHAWHCDHFPGEPVLVFNHHLGEKSFPYTQPKPPLTQLHAISLSSVTAHKIEEITACPL